MITVVRARPKYNVIGAVLAGCILVVSAGCNVGGFLASPTSHEKKVPAEYNLRGAQKKVLVYVDEARQGSTPADVRAAIDAAVRRLLMTKVRIKEQYVAEAIDYAPARMAAYSQLSPVQIGREAGADLVLYVRVESHDMHQLHSAGYFSASVITRSVLLDTASGEVVWPKGEDVKLARIRFELETKGREAAIERLARATAHCVTRHFYDCPGDEFRSGDEQKEYDKIYWQ